MVLYIYDINIGSSSPPIKVGDCNSRSGSLDGVDGWLLGTMCSVLNFTIRHFMLLLLPPMGAWNRESRLSLSLRFSPLAVWLFGIIGSLTLDVGPSKANIVLVWLLRIAPGVALVCGAASSACFDHSSAASST